MTQEQKIIRAKVKGCWSWPNSSAMSARPAEMMGYSRDESFYRFKGLYDAGGGGRCRNSRVASRS